MGKPIKKTVGQNKKNSFNPISLACALMSLPTVILSSHAQAAVINYTGDINDLQTTPSNLGSWESGIANVLFPGNSSVAEASDNIITIDYLSGINPSRVYGGINTGVNAASINNKVTLTQGITQSIRGGFAYVDNSSSDATVNVSNNTITIAGGSVQGGISGNNPVCGGCMESIQGGNGNIVSTTSDNLVIMTGGSVTKNIWGGGGTVRAANGNIKATANNNKIEISGGAVSGTIMAALGSGYSQPNNSLNYTNDINAEYNSITINGGYIGGDVFAGNTAAISSSNGKTTVSASNNTVSISGGYIGGNIYGGNVTVYSSSTGTGLYDLRATNNTVNISGTPTFGSGSSLYGGYIQKGTNGTYTTEISGNTLNVNTTGVTVRNTDGFQSYNFNMPNTVVDGDVMLNATGSVNLQDVTVSLKSIAPGVAVASGSQVNLIQAGSLQTNANTTIQNNVPVYQGISLRYDVDVTQEGNNIIARFNEATVIDAGTKPLSEARLAGLAYTLQGADLAAEQGIKAALASASLGDAPLTAFTTVAGSSSRYNSGSHIDVDGVSMMAGLAWKQDDLVLAGFLEGGKGNYDTYNSFNNAASVHSSGDTSYYGGGILGRYTLSNGVYLDGTARAGKVDTDFKSSDIVSTEGISASYDSKSTYYSASIGAGYAWNLNEKTMLDVSTQYLWTHQNGDSVTVAGDPIEFAAADSHRLRTLGRVYHDVSTQVTLMAGLGYEYEFDGKINATTYDKYEIDAPSIKGGTGIGEMGLSYTPISQPNLTFDAKLRGYAGKRGGYAGFAQVKYAF